jgi:hypothetical protein
MKMSIKTIYTCLVIFAVLCVPYLEGMEFPYSDIVIGYAIGLLLAPLLLTSIPKVIAVVLKKEMNFQKWFNITGTLLVLSALAQIPQ